MAETDVFIPPAGSGGRPVNPESSAAEKEVVKDKENVEEEELKNEERELEGAEEKGPLESKDTLGEEMAPSEAATETDALLDAPSFKEESYNVGELKESERKALESLRAKVEEAIKSKTIFLKRKHSKKEAVAVVETPKEGEAEAAKAEEVAKIEEAESGGAAPPPTEEVESREAVLPEAMKTASTERDLVEVVTEEGVQAPKAESPTGDVPEEGPGAVDVSEGKVSDEKVPEEIPENIGEAGTEETTVREVLLEEPVPPAPKNFFLWDNIPIHDGDERTDVVLLKFLRAREFNVNDAYSMLKSTVSWRKDFAADGLVNEDLGSEFDSLAYMYGSDRDGHPVCYNQYAAFQDKVLFQQTLGDESKLNKFLRWRIQVLEKGVKKLEFTPGGVNFMVQVLDLKNSPGLVKRRQISKQVVTLLQDNYPELVAKQIVINAPWYFPAVYAVFGRLFTPRQVHKVVLATPERTADTLFKYISPEQVPIQYGGLGRPGDTEFEGLDAPVTKITVKPGEKRVIELAVIEPGSMLVWNLSVVGWDVVYGEEFNPSDEREYVVIVQKAKKVPASAEPIRNSFKASKAGKIVLTVDNSIAKTKKTVVYRSAVKKTMPATDS